MPASAADELLDSTALSDDERASADVLASKYDSEEWIAKRDLTSSSRGRG